MKSAVVAVLETRTGEHLGELIARRGGIPLLAPALEEVPDVEPGMIGELIASWRLEPYDLVIFQTGVGTRALFQAADDAGLGAEWSKRLAQAAVVVRGPKPTGELNARGVRIDIRAATPFTTETVLAAMSGIELHGARILVQRYGAANAGLRSALEAGGAAVREVSTYRWALPADTRPLRELLDALAARRVDAVVFTSAVQLQNLSAVAETLGRGGSLAALLRGPVIASIGPVCSRALRAAGIEPTFEADPPKLGPLLSGLDAALGGQRVER
jgi:uroporphyrinogen-III synthase